MSTPIVLNCPDCGSPMVLRETKKFSYGSGQPRKFYGCSTYPLCSAAHGAHPDGKPLGIPADKETKQWRMKAHAAFDELWKRYNYSRKESYFLLQDIMHMTSKEAHIANFDIETCKRLIEKVKDIIHSKNNITV